MRCRLVIITCNSQRPIVVKRMSLAEHRAGNKSLAPVLFLQSGCRCRRTCKMKCIENVQVKRRTAPNKNTFTVVDRPISNGWQIILCSTGRVKKFARLRFSNSQQLRMFNQTKILHACCTFTYIYVKLSTFIRLPLTSTKLCHKIETFQ